MKTAERAKARDLRARGWSVREIERELGVARSSVSTWVRDVTLTPEQRQRLIAREGLGPVIAAERRAAAARALRREHQEQGRRLARERGASFAAGCMLYWAEGGKGRNTVKLTNSDPDLVAAFLAFLREHFDVPNERVNIRCNLFADHLAAQQEIERFWLARLALGPESLRRSIVNTYSKYSQKKRRGKLPYGTLTLCVHSTRIVQTIYGSIQEYGGFERPAWLG
jgi:transcriptional regulator with XRE-family HTH domain